VPPALSAKDGSIDFDNIVEIVLLADIYNCLKNKRYLKYWMHVPTDLACPFRPYREKEKEKLRQNHSKTIAYIPFLPVARYLHFSRAQVNCK
jgi:hypothetical protein